MSLRRGLALGICSMVMIASGLSLSGCREENKAETAAEKVEGAAETTGEKAEEAAESTGEAVEDAVEGDAH